MPNIYKVPFKMTYDEEVRFWEVKATSEEEAREIAVKQLSTDRDVKQIGNVRYIINCGETN